MLQCQKYLLRLAEGRISLQEAWRKDSVMSRSQHIHIGRRVGDVVAARHVKFRDSPVSSICGVDNRHFGMQANAFGRTSRA